jgi:hypothetical protein
MRLSGCQGLPGRFPVSRENSRKKSICGAKSHQADADSALLIRYLRHRTETISAPPYRELLLPKAGKNRGNRELTGKSEWAPSCARTGAGFDGSPRAFEVARLLSLCARHQADFILQRMIRLDFGPKTAR